MLSELERLLYEPEYKQWDNSNKPAKFGLYKITRLKMPAVSPEVKRERAIAAFEGVPLLELPHYNVIDLWFEQIKLPSLNK